MIMVVVLWVFYLSVTLPRSPEAPVSTSTEAFAPAAPRNDNGPSFFKTLGLGWESVWNGMKNSIGNLGNTIGEEWLNLKSQLNRTNDLNLEKPKNGN